MSTDKDLLAIDAESTPAAMVRSNNSIDKENGTQRIIEVHEKTVVRKIDRRIIPLMFACYSLQYLDKTLGKRPHQSYNSIVLIAYYSQLCQCHGLAT